MSEELDVDNRSYENFRNTQEEIMKNATETKPVEYPQPPRKRIVSCCNKELDDIVCCKIKCKDLLTCGCIITCPISCPTLTVYLWYLLFTGKISD